MKNLNIALCQGRHEIPAATDGAIFCHEITNMTDTADLERQAFFGLYDAASRHYKAGEAGYLEAAPLAPGDERDCKPLVLSPALHVNLYVTGLTVALIAALNVCRLQGISVTLWHYDRETNGYFSQEVA